MTSRKASSSKPVPADSTVTAKTYESHDNPRDRRDEGADTSARQPQNGSGFKQGGPRSGQTSDWYGDRKKPSGS